MNNILVVEDDENLRLALVDNLQLESYQVFAVDTMAAADGILTQETIELVILDIMLPDGSGYDFCQVLKEKHPTAMVLMLTARTLDNDLLTGFSVGADDYMTKPYKVAELLARVKALLSRSQSANVNHTKTSRINGFVINWQQRSITQAVNSDQVHLTKKEFDLLYLLFININNPLSREKILDQVWGEGVYVEERTVDNFISVIRKALNLNEPQKFFIRTIRGIGYSLVRE